MYTSPLQAFIMDEHTWFYLTRRRIWLVQLGGGNPCLFSQQVGQDHKVRGPYQHEEQWVMYYKQMYVSDPNSCIGQHLFWNHKIPWHTPVTLINGFYCKNKMEHQEKLSFHSENSSPSKLLYTAKAPAIQSRASQQQAANLNVLPWRRLDERGPCFFSWLSSFCVFCSNSPKVRTWLSWTVAFRSRLPGVT